MEEMRRKILLLENQLKKNNEQEDPQADEHFKSFTKLQKNQFKITSPSAKKSKSSKKSTTPFIKTTSPTTSQTLATQKSQMLTPKNFQTSNKIMPSQTQNPPSPSQHHHNILSSPQNQSYTPTSISSFSQALTSKPAQKQPGFQIIILNSILIIHLSM